MLANVGIQLAVPVELVPGIAADDVANDAPEAFPEAGGCEQIPMLTGMVSVARDEAAAQVTMQMRQPA